MIITEERGENAFSYSVVKVLPKIIDFLFVLSIGNNERINLLMNWCNQIENRIKENRLRGNFCIILFLDWRSEQFQCRIR